MKDESFTNPLPDRCERRRMGLCHSVLDVIARRRRTTHLPLREVFNGLRWIARAGALWRMMPNDLPPWWVVYQQTQRWLAAGCFAALVDDLRLLLRGAKGRTRQPSAAIFDSRTLHSTPESGSHAGYDGAKRRKGSKVHVGRRYAGQPAGPAGNARQ